ncbi:tetratricopeptide repeat protein [Sunxiuqinia sp. A32]|uniref:tetratricopeptide repeat protein n=1 Tax=Sunxiuqinia sp. A32 TaxID=3461496 RepID=UPI0040454AEE
MKYYTQKTAWGLLVLMIILASCSTSKVIVMHQDVAATEEAAGNYVAATEAWNNYFDQQLKKGEEVTPENFARAAKSAVKAERNDLAESWFSLAKSAGYTDPEMQLALADLYLGKNQLSKELAELELFREKYSENEGIAKVNARLFDIYTNIGEEQKALEIWSGLSDKDRHTEKYLNKYFKIVMDQDDDSATEEVAEALIKVNPSHVKALEWLGERYYHKAENQYKKELADYKKNHTHLQYLHLNKQLKIINADFKKSLDHFTKLWEIEQKKVYAGYLSNIYTRFENTQKANYYRKFAN